MGSLFVRTFKRKQISSEEELRNTIFYIHTNPIHHGFAERITDWKYSSYQSLISEKPTQLKRSEVMALFDDIENFKFSHQKINKDLLQKLELEMQNL